MLTNLNKKRLVILDDNYVIREVLKRSLGRYGIYTTDNGVEGLGYIYISKPDLIIIDTTLPKYGGLEVIEYLVTNQSLRERNTPILLIHEGKEFPYINYQNIVFIDKRSKDFLNILEKNISNRLGEESQKIKRSRLGNILINL